MNQSFKVIVVKPDPAVRVTAVPRRSVPIKVSLGPRAGGADPGAAGFQTPENKQMPARLTVADGDRGCDVALTATPGAYVAVAVNGVLVAVGDGTRVNAPSYFSGNAGVTARAWSSLQQGDTWHWQGSIAGYQLAPSDVVDFIYEEG